MAVRGAPVFLFTPRFFFLGASVWVGRVSGLDLSGRPWLMDAAVTLAYMLARLAITLAIGYLRG